MSFPTASGPFWLLIVNRGIFIQIHTRIRGNLRIMRPPGLMPEFGSPWFVKANAFVVPITKLGPTIVFRSVLKLREKSQRHSILRPIKKSCHTIDTIGIPGPKKNSFNRLDEDTILELEEGRFSRTSATLVGSSARVKNGFEGWIDGANTRGVRHDVKASSTSQKR